MVAEKKIQSSYGWTISDRERELAQFFGERDDLRNAFWSLMAACRRRESSMAKDGMHSATYDVAVMNRAQQFYKALQSE